MRRLLVILTACSSATAPQSPTDAPASVDSSVAGDAAAAADAAPMTCQDIDDGAPIAIATAGAAGDYVLTFSAHSASATSWGTAGNEALILEVSGAARGFIGHVLVHQGAAMFGYGTHVGALAAGEPLSIKVSALSAANATRTATICAAVASPVAALGALADGASHAPIYLWPVQKRFNDVPMLVGWSAAKHTYQTVMTNEDGGTAELCGGGALGMQSEIARWGRSTDIEDHYTYAGASPTWERCTGTVPITTTALRMEGDHPLLYSGDGHNRVFESRGGYGQTCGTDLADMPDGDFAGWNTGSNDPAQANDPNNVIVLRPIPVDMDALGYAQFGGRREGIGDTYGPWIYRISSLELAKEGKIDNAVTFGLSQYLYTDVRVADVGGIGDSYCTPPLSGGFKLRVTTTAGVVISSPQITADYASNGAHDWKRVAIALPAGIGAADIDHFTFDAYDDDGIYLTAIGDSFVVLPAGDNGATLDYVRQGTKPLAYYVDDDSSSCTNGVNTGGPGGTPYTCAGSFVDVAK
jgi:hypothetical protein